MFKPTLFALPFALAALITVVPSFAQAQAGPAAGASRPDPSDPAVSVPAVVHRSAFAVYRPFADQEIKDWRESNDNVGRIGGWRAYAREAQTPDSGVKPPALRSPASSKPSASTAPGKASDAHQHH